MNFRSALSAPISGPHSASSYRYWFCMKGTLLLPVVFYFLYCLQRYQAQPFPMGLCRHVDCSQIAFFPFSMLLIIALLVLSLLYLLEKQMLLSTFGLFSISMLILSLDESNGNPAENGIISMLFFAQFAAYFIHTLHPGSRLHKNRINFSLQIVAAVYVLSGLSKVINSGLQWFTTDAPQFTLEILRVYYSQYTSTGIENYITQGYTYSNFLLLHPLLLKGLLLGALLLELGSFLILVNRRIAFAYGLLLLLLNAGIYIAMNITFPTIMVPMLAVAVNPAYHLGAIVNQYLAAKCPQ